MFVFLEHCIFEHSVVRLRASRAAPRGDATTNRLWGGAVGEVAPRSWAELGTGQQRAAVGRPYLRGSFWHDFFFRHFSTLVFDVFHESCMNSFN